jgi:hypothetical protein
MMLLNVVLFIAIALAIIVGVANPILSHYSSAAGLLYSKQSYLTTQSAIEDAIFRLKTGKNMPSSMTLALSSGSATVAVTSTASGKTIIADATTTSYGRNAQVDLTLGTGVAFHYGIQSGEGGFVLENSSSVTGNVFSAGSITGSNNLIRGDVISAGPSGLLNGIHATGTVFAHTIQSSIVDKDAYYQSISGTTVNGILHPGSSDQAPTDLPISDAQIGDWESDAATQAPPATCSGSTYSITSDTTIGPLKIPCNLSIKNATVTINGPIWVTGNIDIKGSTVQMASGLASQNVAIIADNPSNTTGSSIITTDTGTTFYAAGCPSACISGAFVFLISQNNNEETNHNGAVDAIGLGQSSSGLIAYAGHGLISVGQSVSLKEVTAYKIILQNTANVVYDTGLPNTLFEAGPGGGYDLLDWIEI